MVKEFSKDISRFSTNSVTSLPVYTKTVPPDANQLQHMQTDISDGKMLLSSFAPVQEKCADCIGSNNEGSSATVPLKSFRMSSNQQYEKLEEIKVLATYLLHSITEMQKCYSEKEAPRKKKSSPKVSASTMAKFERTHHKGASLVRG